jgi:hypothetical protein
LQPLLYHIVKAKAKIAVIQDSDIQRPLEKVTLETMQQQTKLFERLLKKPFWMWVQQQHKLEDIRSNGDCWIISGCFWLEFRAHFDIAY